MRELMKKDFAEPPVGRLWRPRVSEPMTRTRSTEPAGRLALGVPKGAGRMERSAPPSALCAIVTGILLRTATSVIAGLLRIGATRLADCAFHAKATFIRALAARGIL